MTNLDATRAATFARLTLSHVGQEYPHKLDQVLTGDHDLLSPRVLHPIFHGSFDWHSCVHGWWQLLTLLRLHPELPEAAEIRARADQMFTPDRVAGELAYLDRPYSAGFERPYGWAWLLALHGEASRHDVAGGEGEGVRHDAAGGEAVRQAGRWGEALAPLARAFAALFAGFLPRLTYPLRVGTHFNTAFALTLAHDWAREHDANLAHLIEQRARDWFAHDRACQAWEPSGDEFLSPALGEALLMSRVLPAPAFRDWFDAFLPDLARGSPATLFTPATVSDRSDGKIAHLDGLNLSRAWCWRGLTHALGDDHPIAVPARAAAERHLSASLPHLADDYMGTHWLATFALLALTA